MFSGVLSGVLLQSIWMVINHNAFLSLTFKWDGFPVFWKRSSSVMAVIGAGWYFTFSVRTFPHLWVWKGMKNTIWVTSKQKNSICPWGYLKALFPQHSSSLVGEPSLFHIISVISCSVWIYFQQYFLQMGSVLIKGWFCVCESLNWVSIFWSSCSLLACPWGSFDTLHYLRICADLYCFHHLSSEFACWYFYSDYDPLFLEKNIFKQFLKFGS